MAITRYTKFNQTRYINITNMDDLKFIPVPYELPIFIKKRVNIRKGGIRTHTKLMNHLANYKQYYQEDGKRKRKEMVEFPNFKCEKPNKKMENKSWVPPPNQYTVKYDSLESRMKKQMGKHGPFMCFTVPRDDTTVIGNEHKADGADAYYHIPGSVEEMSWKKNFYKGKISRIDRTKLKATSRNMVNDLNLCNKDPKAPGPCTYNLTNHIIKQVPEAKKIKFYSSIEKYFSNSCVLENPRFYTRKTYFPPGPTRYRPQLITEPCPKIKPLEKPKIIIDDKLKIRRIKPDMCPSAWIRSIPGHGFQRLFKSQMGTKPMPSREERTFTIPTQNNTEYKYIIRHPRRKIISFRSSTVGSTVPKPIKFHHCYHVDRKAPRTNFAFGSSCKRFKTDPQINFEKRNPLQRMLKNEKEKNAEKITLTANERKKIAERLAKPCKVPTIARGKPEEIYAFCPLPAPKVLVPHNVIRFTDHPITRMTDPYEALDFITSISISDSSFFELNRQSFATLV